MKYSIFVYTLFAALFFQFNFAAAQNKKSKNTQVTFQVEGQCGMCKKRIEEAAYIPGVRRAEWTVASQTLTVTYNTKRTSEREIAEAVLLVGHEVNGEEANEEAFKKLPACCNYKDPNMHKH